MKKNEKIGRSIKYQIIMLLARHGWLRTVEIGKFIWPRKDEKNRYKYAHEFVQDLEEKGFVLTKKLDKKAGTAVFLSSLGAYAARKKNYEPMLVLKTAKIPGYWRHQLNSASLMAGLFVLNGHRYPDNYMTEREIGRAAAESTKIETNGKVVKRPDLILYDAWYKCYVSIEAENSGKRGDNNDDLIDYIVETNKAGGTPTSFYRKLDQVEIEQKYVGIAYDKNNPEKPLNTILRKLLKRMEQDGIEKLEFFVYEITFSKTLMVEKIFAPDLMTLYPIERENLENLIDKAEVRKKRNKELENALQKFLDVMEYRRQGLMDDGSEDPDAF